MQLYAIMKLQAYDRNKSLANKKSNKTIGMCFIKSIVM